MSSAGEPPSRGPEGWNKTVFLPKDRCLPAVIAEHRAWKSSIEAVPLHGEMSQRDHRLEHWCSRPWRDPILAHAPDWLSDLVKTRKSIGWMGGNEWWFGSQY